MVGKKASLTYKNVPQTAFLMNEKYGRKGGPLFNKEIKTFLRSWRTTDPLILTQEKLRDFKIRNRGFEQKTLS